MAIQYVTGRYDSGFSIVPGASTPKQDLINAIETALLAAGWSTVSGHNTTNLLMLSATTPQGLAGRLRVKDNAGTCVTLSIENANSTLAGGNSTTNGCYLNPGSASKTYRVIANKYQFFIFTARVTPAREFVAGGVIFVPPALSGVITAGMWIHGNNNADANTTLHATFRTRLASSSSGIDVTNMQTLTNATLWDWANSTDSTNAFGGHKLPVPSLSENQGVACYRWHDGAADIVDAVISWGLAGKTDEGQKRGQLWDAFISTESYQADSSVSYDGHTWLAITDNNNGTSTGNWQRGTLFVCIA